MAVSPPSILEDPVRNERPPTPYRLSRNFFFRTVQIGQRIFVSAENNGYCGWQCKLFYVSAITRLNHSPTFIVHDSGLEWHRDFHDLVNIGATVLAVPSYAGSVADTYKPRNTAGSLIHTAVLCDENEWIVLCDPDMIFTGDPGLSNSLSVNLYRYMDYDRPEVITAMQRLNVLPAQLESQKEILRGGVPYVIPAAVARELGGAWLHAIDAFPPRNWIDNMHAFGLAVTMLGLKATQTDLVDTNLHQSEPVQRNIIHYCYGDETWDKHDFIEDRDIQKLWTPSIRARAGTVLREIFDQIVEARSFYENSLAR
jgi:hypothetical protein